MKNILILILATLLITFCKKQPQVPFMDTIAENYVKLVLEIGQYDGDFVDAYYGPEEWKPKGEKLGELPAEDFIKRASTLLTQCDGVDQTGYKAIDHARLELMKKQLIAVKTKVEMMNGKSFTFDEEAKLLYDAQPPHFSEAHFDSILADLDKMVPGAGELSKRYNDYIKQFIIPKDKLDVVFKTAIAEGRKRTNTHYQLPENENFVL
jgi:hypothetical protein